MEINNDADSVFVALKQETLGKFKQLTFLDQPTGKTMEYNLLVPQAPHTAQQLPLVLFMADASIVGNFIRWEAGSVLPDTGRAMEHMASFDYGYQIAAVRDWLFRQGK